MREEEVVKEEKTGLGESVRPQRRHAKTPRWADRGAPARDT